MKKIYQNNFIIYLIYNIFNEIVDYIFCILSYLDLKKLEVIINLFKYNFIMKSIVLSNIILPYNQRRFIQVF